MTSSAEAVVEAARRSTRRADREPGNRLGALGLLATAVGAGGLAFEVPPELLAIEPLASWACIAVGLALLVGGLLHEWRGPRRWSALGPGALALAFACWAAYAAAAESTGRCDRSVVTIAGQGTVGWSCVPEGSPHAIAVLVRSPWPRGVPALARRLAERGVGVYAVDPSAWIGQPTEVLRAVAERARSQAGDVPLGVVAWGETARSLPDLSEIVDADFAVALSALALEPIEGLDRLARPVLFAYGVDDATYAGHGHASALNEAVGAAGMDRATIRVFLGADRDLLVPVTRASLQPTRIAPGWIDLFTSWIRDATAAE